MKYTGIFIIYNPNSTGDSQSMARSFRRELLQHSLRAKLIPTKFAGHAQKIANQLASAQNRPLIISASGDGGYHEVVNGVMAAGNNNAVCAVLPAGNANDHSRTLHHKDQSLSQQIAKEKITKLDLIKVTVHIKNDKEIVYAHSYVGLGLTPVVATELNKQSLNAIKELMIVVKAFFKYRPFKIKHGSKVIRLDSLLFANINQMAKVLTLAPANKPRDGKFEIIQFPAGRKWQLIKRLSKAAAAHLDTPKRAKKYSFTVLKKMPMQLDGEVTALQPQSVVTVEVAPKLLSTVI